MLKRSEVQKIIITQKEISQKKLGLANKEAEQQEFTNIINIK